MQRTIQTAAKINAPKEQWKALNEINAVGGRTDFSKKTKKIPLRVVFFASRVSAKD